VPVHLLFGEDTYRVSRQLKRLRESLIDPAYEAFSHKHLDAPGPYELTEALGAAVFDFGQNTVIEIHEFPWLAKAIPEHEEKHLEPLKQALSDLQDNRIALFTTAKIDRKLKFPKWLSGQSFTQVYDFKLLEFWKTDEAANMVLQEAKADGITITPDAALLLVEQMGVSLQGLMNEVHKLAVFAADRGQSTPTTGKPSKPNVIDVSDVMALSHYPENTFSMLDDWIHGRKRDLTLAMTQDLLLRQHPVQLFALAHSILGHSLKLKQWQSLGHSETVIAERLKKHPFKIKKDLQGLASVSLERLRQLREKLLDLEYQMKTGRMPDHVAFEVLMSL
jgi:DNA polymerase-3 subunit delta